MTLKEALAAIRPWAAMHQWVGGRCIACNTTAPDHLRSCTLAAALEATAERGACPVCFVDPGWAPDHAASCSGGKP